MEVRSLGFRTDLMLRRLAGASVEDSGDHLVVRTPGNPAFYWGNFLLFPEPPQGDDATRWLTAFAQTFPDAGHVALGVDGTDGGLGDAAELVAAGLTPEVSVVMTADDLLPVFPSDLAAELRPLRADADWEQLVQLKLALEDDPDDAHRDFVVRRVAECRDLVEAGHGPYVGAVVDGVVRAGLGLFTDGSGLGRYQTVETHPDFRRRGLAAGLLALAADVGRRDHGVRRLVIVADPDYVAIHLYHRLGFTSTEQQVQWERAPAGRS